MLIQTITLITCNLLLHAIASPVPSRKEKDGFDSKILYDQRQEGEWNVRAHLDNFVIMILPTETLASGSTSSSPSSLLDFFRNSLPRRSYRQKAKPAKKPQQSDSAQETLHFIESKTAPYHVDITKSNLKSDSGAQLVASSPAIALVTSEVPVLKTDRRTSRHFIVTIPADDEEYVLTSTPKNKSIQKKIKKNGKEIRKEALKLLEAENEQCGPGLSRDSYGICRTLQN